MFFLLAQLTGLAIVYSYMDKTTEGELTYHELPYNIERPALEENTSYIYIMIAILLGAALLLILIRFNLRNVWKFWFLFAVILGLLFAFGAFLPAWLANRITVTIRLGPSVRL